MVIILNILMITTNMAVNTDVAVDVDDDVAAGDVPAVVAAVAAAAAAVVVVLAVLEILTYPVMTQLTTHQTTIMHLEIGRQKEKKLVMTQM